MCAAQLVVQVFNYYFLVCGCIWILNPPFIEYLFYIGFNVTFKSTSISRRGVFVGLSTSYSHNLNQLGLGRNANYTCLVMWSLRSCWEESIYGQNMARWDLKPTVPSPKSPIREVLAPTRISCLESHIQIFRFCALPVKVVKRIR